MKEEFRYAEAKMEGMGSEAGFYFSVTFERLLPSVLAAGMIRCDCESLTLESPLTHIRFIRTDTTGSPLEDISHRFAGKNRHNAPNSLYKSLPELVNEFETRFFYGDDLENRLIFVDKERDHDNPVLFYAEFEFQNGQLLKTPLFTSL
ncbi:MAG: hypothetical protein LRY55_09810 [Leadbetterella sp.]|nr:hypothetical protein [Leadbetterella sp.]